MPQVDPVLGWMAAAAAAAIFAASGALKFYDLETFRGAVTNYRLIPEWLATPFAWTAPVIESAAALGLLLSPIRASAALVLILLLGVFTGAIAINLARGRVDIGIADGVAAWLDLKTSFGNVHNHLDAAAQPAADEESVEVRARTAFGDITVRRALASRATKTP